MTKAHADLKENYSLAAIYISQLEEEKAELLEALKTCLEHFNTTDAGYARLREERNPESRRQAVTKSTTIQVRITPELRGILKACADAEGVKLSEYIRRALELHTNGGIQ
jgi:predicted HicB family RNase H-like nuclease